MVLFQSEKVDAQPFYNTPTNIDAAFSKSIVYCSCLYTNYCSGGEGAQHYDGAQKPCEIHMYVSWVDDVTDFAMKHDKKTQHQRKIARRGADQDSIKSNRDLVT